MVINSSILLLFCCFELFIEWKKAKFLWETIILPCFVACLFDYSCVWGKKTVVYYHYPLCSLTKKKWTRFWIHVFEMKGWFVKQKNGKEGKQWMKKISIVHANPELAINKIIPAQTEPFPLRIVPVLVATEYPIRCCFYCCY